MKPTSPPEMPRPRVGILLIPLIAAGVAVASAASLVDADHDGVPDEMDRCPFTIEGRPVGGDGCSRPPDRDADGVPDVADNCPLSPAGSRVDLQGCALDADLDGIADGLDRCPASVPAAIVDELGCGGVEPGVAVAVAPRVVPPAPQRAAATVSERSSGPVLAVAERAHEATAALLPQREVSGSPVAFEPGPGGSVSPPAPIATPAPTSTPAPRLDVAAGPRVPMGSAADPAQEQEPPRAAAAPRAPARVPSVSPMPRKPVIPRLAEVPPLPGARYVTLYFEPRSSKLVSDSLTLLQQQPDSLSGVLGARPQASLIVVGHADTRSDGDRAALAAARRAESVQQQLVQLGIPAGRIAVRSSGVNEPRFSGGELALNCRVELYVYDPSARPGWNLGSAGLLKTAYLPEAAASVRFQPYSALLDPEATRALDRFLETRIAAPKPKRAVRVRLTGLIDPAETAMPSGPLARGRVEAVRSYLLSAGLGAGLVEVDATPGVGRDPADAGRRVELRVIGG